MTGESNPISNEDIDDLFAQAQQKADVDAPSDAPSDADSDSLKSGEIDALLAASKSDSESVVSPKAPTPTLDKGTPGTASDEDSPDADDLQHLFDQAEQALASVDDPTQNELDGIQSFQLRSFSGATPSTKKATLELLRDVELNLRIELGRTHMYLEDVLKLRQGSVVTLDKLAGDPVDIFVNGRLIARGEVLVLNDNFCIRVAELISGDHV